MIEQAYINGAYKYRTEVNGEWKCMTKQMITDRLLKLEKELKRGGLRLQKLDTTCLQCGKEMKGFLYCSDECKLIHLHLNK